MGTVIDQVLPVVTEVVFTEAPFLYNVIEAVEGTLASILVQVPVTKTDEPGSMGELSTGAAVHVGDTVLMPPPVMEIDGCALVTDCQPVDTPEVASSIP